ncbi:uncharacterized protein LOC130137693 [Syzygium oleosum]|uniref:uncharacterized protein LOC130137693 n=1 Tax=Syzygium oleosum TaxID=219896 RepID=UPI0024B8EC85|nr:uncharacterized protein LOC130137693 [Syzygium oleosum]
MQEELQQFRINKVWELVPRPKNHPVIGTKWVFRNKLDDKGKVTRNKARLVAKGYSQEEGIDYDETYAPVARLEAIRLLLAYACFHNFKLFQMDVKSAFLNGYIKEEVYVEQSPGFEEPRKTDYVYRLKKALYGLKQAPRAWYERLSNFLLQNDFTKGKVDTTLFVKRKSKLSSPKVIKMPFKMVARRRSSRILDQDSKSTALAEYLEVSDSESDHHEGPSEATPPQRSSPPKSSGKTDFRFRSIKRVWEVYQRLKRNNASASILLACLKDNGFRSEEHLVQNYSVYCTKSEQVPASSTSKEPSSRKGKEKVGEYSTPSAKKSVPISPKSTSASKFVIFDNDARFFDTFEMKVGIASGVPGTGGFPVTEKLFSWCLTLSPSESSLVESHRRLPFVKSRRDSRI